MITEIQAKSILRKYKRIDSWFISAYGINLYRGCTHNCVYCDGRTEKYQVEGNFGTDITVKTNAIELLEKELDPAGKRTPFKGGFMVICGGVSDAYQSFEKQHKLCRQTLELLCRFDHPVHILTKSTLVERDLDLLGEIHRQKRAVVSFSFSTVDDTTGRLLEPGVPPPSQRLKTIEKIKNAGLYCGMYLMPVVPFISDSAKMIAQAVAAGKTAGVDFIIFGGMTLKTGIQKDYFMNFIKIHFPELVQNYQAVYPGYDQWGSPAGRYIDTVQRRFLEAAGHYRMPMRMPASIWRPLVSQTELVMLILEQLDYLVKIRGKESPYGYAVHSLAKLDKPLDECSCDDLVGLKGVGRFTAELILEILQNGTCGFYEKMLVN
ncbi:MAG: radical SAM protein [Spirochaetales bacterium]|nr:radical SAM protein [Spirochaetales bacterium]